MDSAGAPKKRLGRGLAALIGDASAGEGAAEDTRALRQLPIEYLKASPNNPRKHFADSDLDDLAASIREKGLLQPIMVRPRSDGAMRSWPASGAGARRRKPACMTCRSSSASCRTARRSRLR